MPTGPKVRSRGLITRNALSVSARWRARAVGEGRYIQDVPGAAAAGLSMTTTSPVPEAMTARLQGTGQGVQGLTEPDEPLGAEFSGILC